jgi:predicted ATP-binding protein involved in virulence
VVNYAKELARIMQNKISEYASLSQSLDRTFPARMIKTRPQNISHEELTQQLRELERKRSKLIETGFLDPEDGMDIKDFNDIPGSKIEVLQLYTEDIQKKLSVFDELTARIELLMKIINWRFLYKKLSISRKDGFIFTTSEGMHLSPTKLSSGEQQELVLFYELLFHVRPNSLILIDEPEISLHVLWQQQFLKDLQSITKLVGFDILIATHSPQIIHDRWDLTVELRGNDNEEISHSG